VSADERLAEAFVAAHPEDAARLLERVTPADAAVVLSHVKVEDAADVFGALAPSAAATCAAVLEDDRLAAIIGALPQDAAGLAMRRVEPARRDRILALLPDDRSAALRGGLHFPDSSAGAIADPLVMSLPEDITVAEAQRQLKGSPNVYYYLYIVSRQGALVGTLAISELMTARPKQPIASVMKTQLTKLDAHTDIATVAAHPAWRDFDALPVVDSSGRLIGAVRHKTIRHLATVSGRPMVDTIVQLSELYWAGLSGILASLTPSATQSSAPNQEDTDVP
jgi:Mg/Co/Ni transporter MgtE